MKIYVVTSGEYSEYQIERVFTDEAKAKLFASHGSDYDLKAYDSEERESTPIYVARFTYFPRGNELTYEITRFSSLDRERHYSPHHLYRFYVPEGAPNPGYPSNFTFGRYVKSDEIDIEKYRKIAQDLWGQCEAHRLLDKWDAATIHEWLNSDNINAWLKKEDER